MPQLRKLPIQRMRTKITQDEDDKDPRNIVLKRDAAFFVHFVGCMFSDNVSKARARHY